MAILSPHTDQFGADLLALTGDSPRVYLMGRIVDYRRPAYSDALRWLRSELPKADIVPARTRWRANDDWLDGWPAFCPTVAAAAVVTVPDPDSGRHLIGLGVFDEIDDLSKLGRPVLWLCPSAGRIQPVTRFRVVPNAGRTWSDVGRLEPDDDAPPFHPRVVYGLAT